jgi:catechol 2,3-dioxygenase-like lactoylglutathione lyase family enzyme
MDKFIAKLVKDFEDKKLTRRQLVHTIQVAAATFAAGEQAANAAPSTGFKTINVNHISYRCPDYTVARNFYQHLMGMGVTGDSGRQCDMPFGPLDGSGPSTFLLPRGYPATPANYTSSGTITAPPTPPGGATARGGNRGGRGGADTAAAPPQPPPERVPNNITISHIAYTMKNWDKARVKAVLESWGLFPTEDGDSYHVRDPFGYDLQISGPGMHAYEAPQTNANGGGGD